MEAGWIRPRGRRRAPGRPLTYGTTEDFLVHFGLDNIKDLPGLADLKAAGLLDANLPPGFTVPSPTDVAALMPDELPLTTMATRKRKNRKRCRWSMATTGTRPTSLGGRSKKTATSDARLGRSLAKITFD